MSRSLKKPVESSGEQETAPPAAAPVAETPAAEAPAPEAPVAPQRVMALRHSGGTVVALTNIKRLGGHVRAGQEFTPTDDTERAQLHKLGCIKEK